MHIEIQYLNYLANVTKCSCCNKYNTDTVIKFKNNSNNFSRVFITAQANTLIELVEEFQVSVDDYLEFQEELSNKIMKVFDEVVEKNKKLYKRLANT